MRPIFEEFCRANGALQMSAFRRMQREFRDEIGPLMERLEAENPRLLAENETLKARVAELESKKRKAGTE